MINQLKSRLAQLEGRLRKISFKHKEVHEECFPDDGMVHGVYHQVGHKEWESHPLKQYLGKSSKVLSKIRREMLAILYYIKIMETRQSTTSLISNTNDTINKYGYLFDLYSEDDKINVSLLYSKTKEEIKRSNMTRLERMKTFPKEQNYSMFTQEGNLAVNRMMIELIETLQGKSKVSEDDFKTLLEKGVNSVDASGHGEVYDTAVREVVLGILEKEVEKSGYNWSMALEI
jgi:hypothetical protein